MFRRRSRKKVQRTLEVLEKRNLLFAPTEQITLTEGLESVESSLDRLESHAEYAQEFPALEQAAGSIIDLSSAVRTGVIDPLQSVLDATGDVSVADVVDTLDGFVDAVGDTVTRIQDGSASGKQSNESTEAKLEFTAIVEQTRTLSSEFSSFGEAEWISWSGSAPELTTEVTTEIPLTFGVDLVSGEFYAVLSEVTSEIRVESNEVSAGLAVGPLETELADGEFSIEAELKADFGDAKLTNDSLASSLDALVEIEGSGSFDASLPVSYALGSYSGSDKITWSDSSVFDGTIELPELSEDGDLANFVRIDAEDLAGFFSLIGSKLDELLDYATQENEKTASSSSKRALDDFLPWLEDLKLPDLSGVSDKIEDFVGTKLRDEDGRASFVSLQELKDKIDQLTDRETLLGYLPDTKELTFEFAIPAPIEIDPLELEFFEGYDPIGAIETTGTVQVSGDVLLSGVWGVDLSPLAEDTTPDDITDNDSWSEHFYLQDLELNADIEVASDTVSAAANLGFVEVAVGEVLVSAQAAAAIQFEDDQSSDGRISFKRLSELAISDPLAAIKSTSLDGSAELGFKQLSVDGIPGLELDGGEITIGIGDITDPGSFDFDANEAVRNINALSTVTLDQWVDLAGDVISFLDDLTKSAKWDEPLPGVGKSVNDLLDVAEKLQIAATELLDTDEESIQAWGEEFEQLLEDALSLDPSLLDVVLSWESDSLEMKVTFTANTASSNSLSVDVAQLIQASSDDSSAFDLLQELVDVSGAAELSANAEVDTTLVFGADLSSVLDGTSTVPTLYVGDETGVSAELNVSATEFDTSMAVGPLGLFIVDGRITLDGDGDASTAAPAKAAVSLKEVTDGMYSVEDLSKLEDSDFDVEFEAGASLVLPLYFPTESDPVGGTTVGDANAIIAAIGNVAGLFNDEDPLVQLQAPDLND